MKKGLDIISPAFSVGSLTDEAINHKKLRRSFICIAPVFLPGFNCNAIKSRQRDTLRRRHPNGANVRQQGDFTP